MTLPYWHVHHLHAAVWLRDAHLAKQHPAVVKRLTDVADAARLELGDYNRIGAAARFFDDGPRRPLSYFPEAR